MKTSRQSSRASREGFTCRFAIPWGIVVLLTTVFLGNCVAEEDSKAIPKPAATAYAVQIEPVTAEEGELPAEFAMAIYENLVEQVTKTGKFQQVFRSGDKRAAEVPNLLILTSTLERFQRGSQTKRAVTTVGGATKIAVNAKLVTRDSQVKFERTVEGKVRMFGENLKATQALAKNIAKLINQSSL